MDALEKILEEIESNKNNELPIEALANHNYREGYVAGMALAQEIIREHLNHGWIPVEERLPEKPIFGEDSYIVQHECIVEPFSAYWDGEKWSDSYEDTIKNIVAWMPLPEPYHPNPCTSCFGASQNDCDHCEVSKNE